MTTNEVLTRQVAGILPAKKELEALMKKRKIRLYLGVDPTGGNLHLGHAIALRKLQQFASLGHEAILLVGTGTVLAGDPSQRDTRRAKIAKKEIVVEECTDEDREYLDLDKYDHVVVVKNFVHLKDATLFEYTESRHRLDMFRFVDFARRKH